MIPFAILQTPPTADSVRAFVISGLVSLGIPANLWNPRGVAYGGVTAVSSVFAAVVAQLVGGIASAPFITIAVPPYNAVTAQYVYGVIPNPATYATGFVTLTNPAQAQQWNKAAGTVVVGNSQTGMTYLVTVPFTLAPGATVTGLAVQATSIGSVGTAVPGPGAGSIDTVITPMIGVTVTNPAAVAGQDADSVQTVIAKCLNSIAARSYKGPPGAYQYAVATTKNSSGQPVNINRWQILTNTSTGQIIAYLASPTGVPVAGDIVATQTQLVAVAQPMGITVTAQACTVVPVSSSPTAIAVWMTSAGTATAASIATALVAALADWPIGGRTAGAGGFLFGAWLKSRVMAVDPAIYDVIGFADVPLSAGQIAQLTSTTTFTINVTP